ncbi:polysaccharide pyruvyl transferase family protein [Alkalibacterium sp. 20]|uniref:polysaccharide pyruvyl transferase family protein n=1 Tax=Alkalibacterium sp. 20 TaxID=1798803 RepID=UPI0009000112|nr:polysaccharide pyruvyl transferase family protein [Alkalibacterium sp. 20]OJF94712.1 hypothetical protein AX762_07100 [Alkalibacterium sp. 20]
MSHVSLHGAYFPNNYGDVLILNIEADWIKELTNKEVSLPFATEIYRKTLQSNDVKESESIKTADYMIYGAGGYLGEPPTKKAKWSLKFMRDHLKPAMIANKNKTPYSIIGAGAGPVSPFYGHRSLKYIVDHAEVIAVRDEESKQYLDGFVNDPKKVFVTADVALSLTKADIPAETRDKIMNEYLNFEGLKIGVHIGADRHSKEHGENVQMIIDESIEFFKQNEHLTPVLIIDNENDIQLEAVDYIKKELKKECVVYKHYDIWETTTLLSELDTVLTNKLHIGIVNYAMGNIPISFPYHSKTKRFYKQIDLEQLCTPIAEVKRDSTFNLLNQVINDIDLDKKDKYQLKRNEMMEKALMNKEILNKVLTK